MNMSNKPTPSIEELSAAMEKMYQEHNAEVTTLSRMITTLARLTGQDPNKLAHEMKNDAENFAFADAFNTGIDENMNIGSAKK